MTVKIPTVFVTVRKKVEYRETAQTWSATFAVHDTVTELLLCERIVAFCPQMDTELMSERPKLVPEIVRVPVVPCRRLTGATETICAASRSGRFAPAHTTNIQQ